MAMQRNYPWVVPRTLRVRAVDALVYIAHQYPETVARVRDFILANPDVRNDTSKYIIGGGWDHTIWPASNLPMTVRVIPLLLAFVMHMWFRQI